MTNREKKIVSLLEEGFSYDTIKKMSDTHINMLYNRLVKEAVVRVDAENFGKIKDEVRDGDTIEVTEDDAALDKIAGIDPNEDPNPEGNEDGPSDNMNANDGMNEDFFGDINEDEVLEDLFGKPKKKMKTPITTLGMFESKKEKIRQIEKNILSLINKSQGKMFTKKDILEQGPSIAPTKPTVKPGVRPERGTPYKPKHSPKPKAGTEVKPARPTVKPGVRPERGTPYKPKHSPKPKAGGEQDLPEFLKFNNLNIKFRDE